MPASRPSWTGGQEQGLGLRHTGLKPQLGQVLSVGAWAPAFLSEPSSPHLNDGRATRWDEGSVCWPDPGASPCSLLPLTLLLESLQGRRIARFNCHPRLPHSHLHG